MALASIGVSEATLSVISDRYQRAIAQPTRRKLALLVGINQYPEQVCDCVSARGTALNGCITDVKLQRELLVHRFGFNPNDIVTLTNQQATREGIETAFLSHLTEQAQPGDVVVFHFSGFGSRVRFGDEAEVQRSLVPIDGVLPTEERPVIHDLPLETLGLLLRSLSTENVTTVLDTSYIDPGKGLQGNLHVRSRPNVPRGQVNEAELALQEKLFSQIKATRSQIKNQWRSGQLPGVVLSASSPNLVATEVQWNGFSAGLFTYALTQQLWWATPSTTLRIGLSRASGTVERFAGKMQQPYLAGQKIQDQSLSAYYLTPRPADGADGVVTAVEEDGKTVQLWLAGLPAAVLEHYTPNALLSVQVADEHLPTVGTQDTELTADASPPKLHVLQVRSRDGLMLRARPLLTEDTTASKSNIQVGQFVQESLRILPRNIGLTVALDASLERIERVDATSAFSAIPRVSSVVAGEQPADCLFGKAQPSSRVLATALASGAIASSTVPLEGMTDAPATLPDEALPGDPNLPALHKGYGLFYPGRAIIPSTVAEEEEAVKTAVNRVAPQLHTLLATKLLRLTNNSGSSRLGVRATLEMVAPQERIIMQQETARSPWTPPESRLASLFVGAGEIPTLPINSRIQYRLQNYSDRPVYFILLGLDSNGSAIALYPTPATVAANVDDPKPVPSDSIILPGDILTVPQISAPSEWVINGPIGCAETYLIFSRTPLTQTFAALEGAMRSINNARRVSILSKPLEVAQALLRDLHQASLKQGSPKADVPADTYALDVNTWATLSFIYRVTEA